MMTVLMCDVWDAQSPRKLQMSQNILFISDVIASHFVNMKGTSGLSQCGCLFWGELA